jgi:ribulose-phosphate 3-epimerase
MKVAIALKPDTPAEAIDPYADQLDMVLVMTVVPGFSGQSFMGEMMPKVKAIRAKYPEMDIQVDGGLSPKTVDSATAAGANVVVAASAIFGSNDRKGVIDALRASIDRSLA